MTHDRDQFQRLVAQLRHAIDTMGDRAFADALTNCLRNATTSPQWPLARLRLALHENNDRPPLHPAESSPSCPPSIPQTVPRFVARGTPEQIFEDLLWFLKSR